MSLSIALGNALTGLRANSQLTNISSNNIANAYTDGYTKKSADTVSYTVGGSGRGVTIGTIQRQVNEMLIKDARTELGNTAYDNVRSSSYANYIQALGKPENSDNLSAMLTNLETKFQQLSDSPDSTTLQKEVLFASQSLTSDLKELNDTVRTVRENADADIKREVDDLNNSLHRIKDLNSQIAKRFESGGDTVELLDQRDRLLNDISEKIPIKTIERDKGEVIILTTEGVPLLEGNVNELEFSNSTYINATDVYDPTGSMGTGYTNSLSGITVNGVNITPNQNSYASISSGSIAGLFEVRDKDMVTVQKQLDQIASGIIDRFEDPVNDTSLTAGDPGLFTDNGAYHDRTDTDSIIGISGRIQVNDAVDPEKGGYLWRLRDGVGVAPVGIPPSSPFPASNDEQILRFQTAFTDSLNFPNDTNLSNGMSLKSATSELVGLQHSKNVTLNNTYESQRLISDTALSARDAEQGVNIDEELQNILTYEKSYQANAQVMRTVSEMFDVLLSI